jgi:hypothetical protein
MSDYSYLIGHRFPGARYELPPWLCWLWSDTARLPADTGVAHPALAYYVAMRGVGAGIQEIFDLMDAAPDSGVMFGECDLEYTGVILPGTTYDCEAQVIDIQRKHGRRVGTFDRFVFRITIHDAESAETVVTCTYSWIFPRAEDPAE